MAKGKRLLAVVIPFFLIITGLVFGLDALKFQSFQWAKLSDFDTEAIASLPPVWKQEAAAGNYRTLQIFLDLECPACREYIKDVLPHFVGNPQLAIEIFDMPLAIHPNAVTAGGYSRCLAKQSPERYIEFITKVAEGSSLEPAYLEGILAEMNIDASSWEACVQEEARNAIATAMRTSEAGINVSPFTIIQGKSLRGYIPAKFFLHLVKTAPFEDE